MLEREEELGKREQYLNNNIEFLRILNIDIAEAKARLAKLRNIQSQVMNDIATEMNHNFEGQKQYRFNNHKLVIKKEYKYVLDVDSYTNGKIVLPQEFNPIKQELTYKVDKRLYKNYFTYGPQEIRTALSALINPVHLSTKIDVETYDE